MTAEILRVREGNTGVLYLARPDGTSECFVPNCDLDQARELLLEFQEVRDEAGRALKDNYWADGYNWYPTVVSYLYWHVFYPYVRYTPLVREVLDSGGGVEFDNHASFYRLLTMLRGGVGSNPLKQLVFFLLLDFNNWRVLRRHRAEMVFLRFTVDDFRSVDMRRALDSLEVRYIEVVPPDKRLLLRNLRTVDRYYFFGGRSTPNHFRHRYRLDGVNRHKRILFERAVEATERIISARIREYGLHRRRLRHSSVRVLYGFDDNNDYVFPVLYACQRNGIRTVAHQHGAYVRRHASYVMEGIARNAYKWFDQVIVWGQYWKDHLLKISNVYSPEMFVVGCNRLSHEYRPGPRKDGRPTAVLVPYEFATNTHKVGRYIVALMELGYMVFFKPRPDESLEAQLEAYAIPEQYAGRLTIVDKIDDRLMEQVDIVAGTMTTLVYELLPYNKIVWVLDTEYRHLEDLVEDGLAHKVRLEDLATLDERYFVRTEVDAGYFFNPLPLREVIARYVLGRSS